MQLTLRTGAQFTATFMGVEDDAIKGQKRTRIPEAPILIPLKDVASLGLDQGGMGTGKAVAIGAGVGAGAFLLLILLAMAASGTD